MDNQIVYISKFLGIALDDTIIAKMAEKLQNFDGKEFVDFMENSTNRVELEYKTTLQKFVVLCDMFNKKINKDRSEQALSQAQALALKLREIKTVIKNEITSGKPIGYCNLQTAGANYFSVFEIKTLNAIGDIKYVVMLDDCFKLEDAITAQFNNLIYLPMVTKIGHNTKMPYLDIKRF